MNYNGPHSEFHDTFWKNYTDRTPSPLAHPCSSEAVYIGRAISVAKNRLESELSTYQKALGLMANAIYYLLPEEDQWIIDSDEILHKYLKQAKDELNVKM
jgi:hypothetical protein